MSSKRFTVSYKIKLAEVMLNRGNTSAQEISNTYNVSVPTLYEWVKQYKGGLLSLDNAIAISHKPDTVDNGNVYIIDNKRFHTKDECIKYAVNKLGGITLEITRTETVEV